MPHDRFQQGVSIPLPFPTRRLERARRVLRTHRRGIREVRKLGSAWALSLLLLGGTSGAAGESIRFLSDDPVPVDRDRFRSLRQSA